MFASLFPEVYNQDRVRSMNDDIRRKIDDFFSGYRVVKYPKNQILLFPGDSIDKVFYLVSGRVCQYDISYRGDDVIINTFKPPAFFPMAMVVDEFQSNFFYRTESDTEVRVAPASDVLAFLERTPDATFDLLKRVYIGVESLLKKMVLLMSGTARTRLIYEIVIEHRRFGEYAKQAGHLYLSEVSLAARTGLSRETVNRELKHLKEQHLIEVKKNKLIIIDVDKLEETLESQP